MTYSYFIRTRHLDPSIDRASIVSMNWTPTLHFYGRLETREHLTDYAELGLSLADDEGEGLEAEASVLYRAETRCGC